MTTPLDLGYAPRDLSSLLSQDIPRDPRARQPWRQSARALGLASALTLLAGCASLSTPGSSPSGVPESEQHVRDELQKTLVRVQQHPSWSGGADRQAPRPDFTQELISVAWQGDASVLLAEVAKQRGLRFRVTGPMPRLPIFVFVDANGMPYLDFLRDIGLQFGQRADVVLGDETLEIRYR